MSNVAVVNGSTAEEVVSPGGPRHSAGRRGPHDETLAGLRGIACVLVVASHLWTVVPRDTLNRVGPFRGVFASGNLAVSVFLVLGGFLVTRGLLGEIDRTGSVSPFRFLVRRLVRIGAQLYPFLVAVVVVTWFDRRDDFTAGSTGASVGAAGRFTLNFQFIRDAVGSRPDMGHLWYLSVEMQFYVVWVVVLVWFGRYRRHLGVALALAAVAMMTSRWYVLDHDGWWQASLRTTTRADGLCLGALAAIALPGIRRRGTRVTGAVVALSLTALVTLVATTPWRDQFAYLRAQGIAFVVAATVLVLALARAHDADPVAAAERGVVRRVLSSRFLGAIGRVSLPLYIWHLPAFYAASRWAPGVDWQLRLALVAGALAVIVAASHRYLQQPAERWLARTALTAPDDAPPVASDIADRPTLFDRARRRRRHARFGPIPVAERVAGAASLAPIMIAVLRAGATGWTPEYDAGYFTARSLDVFTRHQPLVGAWSTLGATLNGSYNNLGPLQLLTLAPFTRIEPYWGTAVGVGVVNGLAVVTVWAVARRLFGPTGVVGVLLATTMLELSFGSLALVDPRQQVALILPFWALLWLTLGIMNAIDFAAPAWVLAASFVLQTHFSYAYMTVVLTVIGVIGFFSANRRRWNERRFRRVVGGSCALAVACWALPLWDQFFGSGNMGGVIGVAGGREPSGLNVAAQVLADSPLTPPFWLPPTLRSFREPWSFSPLASWVVVVVWIAALGVAAVAAAKRRRPTVVAMAGLSIATIVAALATASRIYRSSLGLLPQNYFWMWPISLFGACAGAATFALLVRCRRLDVRMVTCAGVVVSLAALPESQVFPPWDLRPELTAFGERPLVDDIGRSLEIIGFDLGPAIVVDPASPRVLLPFYYAVLAEIRRHGYDLHFVAGSDNLFRFGADRCEDGEEAWRLDMVVGPTRPSLGPDDIVLVQRDGPPPAAEARLYLMRSRVSRALLAGEFDLDRRAAPSDGVEPDEPDPVSVVGRVIDEQRGADPGLWLYLPQVVDDGRAVVPDDLADTYRQWLELERAGIASEFIVYLTPNWFRSDGCPP